MMKFLSPTFEFNHFMGFHFQESEFEDISFGSYGHVTGDEEDDDAAETALEAEAKEAGVTVDELKETKAEEALKKEAEESDIPLEELRAKKAEEKSAKDAKDAEDKEKEEAAAENITVEALREKKELAEAEAAGLTVEELRAKKEEEKNNDDDDDDDPFLIKDEDEDDDEDDSEGSLMDIADELEGLELEEGETLTTSNLKDIWNRTVAASKQEFNLDEQPAEVRAIVNHTQNNGNLMDFYGSPQLRDFDRFLSQPIQDQYIEVIAVELKKGNLPDEQIEEQIEKNLNELSEDELKAAVKDSVDRIQKAKAIEINKISAKSSEIAKQNLRIKEEKAAAENKSIISIIKGMKTYKGLPISENAIASMVKSVENGSFHKVINGAGAKAKIAAFMDLMYGEKLMKMSGSKNESKTSYKKGAKKTVEKVFNKDEKKGGANGTSQEKRTDVGEFKSWKDMDI